MARSADVERLAKDGFEDEVFEGLDLTGADLSERELARCTFRDAKLDGARWDRSRLEDCTFVRCTMKGFRPSEVALRDVSFVGCELAESDWSAAGTFPAVRFTDCDLRRALFVALALRKTVFRRCSLRGATFARVDLAGATFDDCDLARAELDACELGKSDLSTSRGVYFDPTKNKAKGARISLETAALVATAMGLVVKGFVGGGEE